MAEEVSCTHLLTTSRAEGVKLIDAGDLPCGTEIQGTLFKAPEVSNRLRLFPVTCRVAV